MEIQNQAIQIQDIQIRIATAADCPRLLELIRELAMYEKAPHEVTVTLDEFVEAGFGKNPVWKSFVAVHQNTIVGFALFYIRYSTWKGRRLYLEDLLVTEDYRGRGIGTQLFNRVIKEAIEHNFNGMNWQVLDWNTPAIHFYDKYNARYESDWLNASFSEEQLRQLL